MAKRRKKRAGKNPRKMPKALAKAVRKGKKAGDRIKPQKKARVLIVNPAQDVWDVQNALRNDRFFARAIAPHKVLTNAPITRI